MANPQIENGHVDIANDIAEVLAQTRISGTEWQIVWVILRKTYGWHKKVDQIALSQLTFIECKGCDQSVYDGMNLKCAATGEKIYIHLIEKCPKKEKKRNDKNTNELL